MSRLPWLIVLLAVTTGLGIWLGSRVTSSPATPLQYQALLAYGQPRALSAFDLAASDGSRLNSERLRGHYSIVFFGFTHCPDICPTALAAIREIENLLTAQAEAVQVNYVFISVDPERDDAAVLNSYAKYFSANLIAASGLHEELSLLTREMGVLYAKQPENEGAYSVDHSTHFVVLNPDVEIIGIIRPPHIPAAIADDLRQLARAK